MAARRRARPKERALDADPVLRSRVVSDLARGRTPRQISGRLKAEACGKVGTMADSPAADGRTISHEAIYTWIHTPSWRRNLVGARDRAALTALGAQGGPRRRAQAPDRGHAVDRAGALTSTTGRYRGTGRTRPDHRQEAGPALARPWSSAPRATSSWWAFPSGREGAAWCGRSHPPHPRTARRRDEHPDLGPGERNGPPPAPDRRHRNRACSFAPPRSPWDRRSEREHQPPPRAATCPKAPPSPATNPCPAAIADEPGNRPRATLDHPTPQETPTHLIATTP